MAGVGATVYYVRVDARYIDPWLEYWLRSLNDDSPEVDFAPGGHSGGYNGPVGRGIRAAIKVLQEEVLPRLNQNGGSQNDIDAVNNLISKLEAVANDATNLDKILTALEVAQQLVAANILSGAFTTVLMGLVIVVVGLAIVELAARLYLIARNCGLDGARKLYRLQQLARSGFDPNTDIGEALGLINDLGDCVNGTGSDVYTTSQMAAADFAETGSTDGWDAVWTDQSGFPEEQEDPCPQCEQNPCICF